MRTRLFLLTLVVFSLLTALPVAAQEGSLTLTPLGSYNTNTFAEGGAEIVAYDAATSTLFVVNGASKTIDLIDITDPTAPALKSQIDVTAYGDGSNSVAVYGDLVAVAIQADPSQEPGVVAFFTTAGEFVASVPVGALPDMLTFTPDGSKVLVANEGEPSDDYATDPEGSVSIIDLAGGAAALTEANVTTVGFADFNADGARVAEFDAQIRVYGPGATFAQDAEPEYIVISPDGTTAYVTLQEDNALVTIDIATGTITALRSWGFKDHSIEGNGIDATDEDGAINIALYPVFGMYQPDGMAIYTAGDALY
ncbi:MAG: choice-of-anchor I family protein, partial [Armatimonadetes bacterium]|nr:choice-of-anchor I family protein [Anaerolineae bacterium]